MPPDDVDSAAHFVLYSSQKKVNRTFRSLRGVCGAQSRGGDLQGIFGSLPIRPTHNLLTMRINRAIGLGIGILVLQMLMSEVFSSFENTLIATFDTTQVALSAVERGIATSTTSIPIPGVE